MSTDAPILAEAHGRVGVITLNRPKQLNALNDALMDALGQALLAFDADDGIGAVVITGGAKAFAAGADIAAMVDWTYIDVFRSEFITRNWETIRRVRKPVIAAVAGFAMGGGCELALACDIVVAAESAKFALPEIKLAMLPGAGGTQRLPRIVGQAKALEIMFAGDPVDAVEAYRIGLINRLAPKGQALAEAKKMVAVYEDRAPLSLAWIKRSVHRGMQMDLASALEFETFLVSTIYQTADRKEGIGAFLGKRKAKFSGK